MCFGLIAPINDGRPSFPGGTEDYRGLKSASYSAQRITARIIPPAIRVSTAPQPFPYLCSVIEPLPGNHSGSRNQARGEISINAALTAMTTTITAIPTQPKRCSIGSRNSYANATPKAVHSGPT